ncbi:hypothetical protein [Acinetobacter guerrae]|uniref:hypothetical protein n=1 Tax=Acinetobacter guerrae TaxID=1843371 RepID=UPI00125F7216|nr:hypothetical protein [Acinetobacter guerrae]
MTFIIAIQLEDSVIIAADNRSVKIDKDGNILSFSDGMTKLYLWENGVITGAGEVTLIYRAIDFFIKLAKSKIETLPKCLKISRMLRELEVESFQIQITKLLYSYNQPNKIQLYSIQPDHSGEYQVKACEENEILIWLFSPHVEAITPLLKKLYSNLRSRHSFNQKSEWFEYYIIDLCEIFKIQAGCDSMMSSSFSYVFQSKEDYILGHTLNIH